jgi:CubicO group peptidase (beta-lactamase class C family)
VPENLQKALVKGMWPQPIDKDRLFEHIKDAPLDFKPGEKWSYSNTGYALLGQIIEKLTGTAYGDFLKMRIFEPLEMNDTGIDNRRLVLKNRANNYGMALGQTVHAVHIDLSQVFSAGSMYSTVGDLLKWDNALFTDKLLPQSSLARMWTPVKNGYGYGWMIENRLGRERVLHTGGLPGCNTIVIRHPRSRVFVALLCNLEGSAIDVVSRDLAAIAHGDLYDVPAQRVEAKIDVKLLDAYVGEYELRPKFAIQVAKEGERLTAKFPNQPKLILIPESDMKFFTRAAELTVQFQKDEKGKVTGLVVHNVGRDQKWEKVK